MGGDPVTTGVGRRGRPPGPVTDLPAPEGYAHHPESRVGWLLRGWRLAAMPDSNARGFAALLNDHGVAADASRVSRWETGQVAAPFEVIEGYEDLLGLPPGGLLGVTGFQRRMASGSLTPTMTYGAERVSPAGVERVLDAAYDGEPTGRDWFELAMTATTLGERLVLPRAVWDRIAGRLVGELGRSVGNAYISRGEAANLFTLHPGSQRALVYAIGEHVTDPDNLLLTDPMAILQEIESPQANDLVLRLLAQPTPRVRRAAAWATSAKVSRGHFTAADLRRVEAIVAEAVRERGLEEIGTFSRIVDLVAVLPAPARERLARLARPVGADGSTAVHDIDPARAQTVAAEVAGLEATVEDPLFAEGVRIALCHDNAERRFLAAFTLKVSARRADTAAGCAEQVRRHLAGEQVHERELLHRLMLVLSVVGGEPERDLLTRIATGAEPLLRPLALTCLAHLPDGPLPDLAALVGADDEEVARTALYCAGMHQHPGLAALADDIRLADWKRRSARWWRDRPGAIHEPGRPCSEWPGR